MRFRYASRICLFFLLTLFTCKLFAQAEISNWYFGDSCHLKFTPDSVYHFKSGLNMNEGSSSISDSNGNVIFYTNGVDVLNADNQKINDQSLKAFYSSIQSALVIPLNDSMYIITTASPDSGVFSYKLLRKDSLVILNPNGTKLINGYNKTPQGGFSQSTEAQHAVNHQNNLQTWVSVKEDNYFGTYSLFLSQDTSLMCCPKITKTLKSTRDITQDKFSPSGKYLATTGLGVVYLFRFDNHNGEVLLDTTPGPLPILGPISISMQGNTAFNIAFSQHEDFLYVSTWGNKIYQFDIREYDFWKINDSRHLVHSYSSKTTLAHLQLTPYGNKIAVAVGDSNHLALIHNSDSPYVSGNFEMRGIFLGNDCSSSYFGLPEFNASYYYNPPVDFKYTSDCNTNNYQFEVLDPKSNLSYVWNITALNSSDSWHYSGDSVHHVFINLDSIEQEFEVQLIASFNGTSDTMTKTLFVYEPIDRHFLGHDTALCDGQPIILRTPDNLHCIHWNGEEPNLDSSKGEILNYGHFQKATFTVDSPGTYFVKVTHKTFCQVWDTIVVYADSSPVKAQISQKRDTLFSSELASKYFWFKDDQFIKETDTSYLVITEKGRYRVNLGSINGCLIESDEIIVDNVSVFSPRNLQFIAFPNPSNGIVHLEFPDPNPHYIIEVTDLQGRIVEFNTLEQHSQSAIVQLPRTAGSYCIKVLNEDGSVGFHLVSVY